MRAAAATSLVLLYSKPENHLKLENFTARFLKRLEDLIHDTDSGVQLKAIQILCELQKAGYLDETAQEVLDEVDEMLLDPTWSPEIRQQAMTFFTDRVDGFNEGGGSGRNKKAKRETVAHRLVTVVQFLEYHLAESFGECGAVIDTCVDSFDRHPDGDFLFDWRTYFELLREDKKVQRLTEREHSILIRLLAAAIKLVASRALAPPSKKKAETRYATALEAFTSGAVQELPALLSQFQVKQARLLSLMILRQRLARL